MPPHIKFIDSDQSDFFITIKHRVHQYFQETGYSRHGNLLMKWKAFFFLAFFTLLYGLLFVYENNTCILAFLAALIGAFNAFIGFNICHDASHGSFSKSNITNKLLSLLFNLIGANAYLWNIGHNMVHHCYTNIQGHDDDIDIAPGLIRLSSKDKLKKFHKYQYLYIFILYALTSLNWVFIKDFSKFLKKDKTGKMLRHPAKEYFILFFSKVVYYSVFIIIPMLLLPVTPGQFIEGFIIMHVVMGLIVALVFQVAHLVEQTASPEPNAQGYIEEAWAVHQLRTTANFSCKNKIAFFFFGGLNFQIEHHLFPKICHVHYPAISVMVKQEALAHGLPYIENPSFAAALTSHVLLLKKYGREEPVKPFDTKDVDISMERNYQAVSAASFSQ